VIHGEVFNGGWGVGWGAWGASEGPPLSEPSPDHRTAAQRRLIGQYQEDLAGMVPLTRELAGAGPQALEDASHQIPTARSLVTAYGASLELLAPLMGTTRGGLEDNSLRWRLFARALAAASNGSPEHLRAPLDALLCGLQPSRLREDLDAVTVLLVRELDQADGEAFASILALANPAGSRVILQWELPVREGATFGWEGDSGAGIWAEWGANPSPAGLWAEASDGGIP